LIHKHSDGTTASQVFQTEIKSAKCAINKIEEKRNKPTAGITTNSRPKFMTLEGSRRKTSSSSKFSLLFSLHTHIVDYTRRNLMQFWLHSFKINHFKS